MNVKIATSVRNAMAAAIKNALEAGSGAAVLKVYTGAQPATPETAVTTQTLLGTLTFSDPVGSTTGGVLTFDSITQDAGADASGTAAWVRLQDSAGNAVMDGDVTNSAGTGFLKLNTVTIAEGGPLQIPSATLTMPGG